MIKNIIHTANFTPLSVEGLEDENRESKNDKSFIDLVTSEEFNSRSWSGKQVEFDNVRAQMKTLRNLIEAELCDLEYRVKKTKEVLFQAIDVKEVLIDQQLGSSSSKNPSPEHKRPSTREKRHPSPERHPFGMSNAPSRCNSGPIDMLSPVSNVASASAIQPGCSPPKNPARKPSMTRSGSEANLSEKEAVAGESPNRISSRLRAGCSALQKIVSSKERRGSAHSVASVANSDHLWGEGQFGEDDELPCRSSRTTVTEFGKEENEERIRSTIQSNSEFADQQSDAIATHNLEIVSEDASLRFGKLGKANATALLSSTLNVFQNPPKMKIEAAVEKSKMSGDSTRVSSYLQDFTSLRNMSSTSQGEYNPAELFGGSGADAASRAKAKKAHPGLKMWTRAGEFFQEQTNRDLMALQNPPADKPTRRTSSNKLTRGLSRKRTSMSMDWNMWKRNSFEGDMKTTNQIKQTKAIIQKSLALLQSRIAAKQSILLPSHLMVRIWAVVMTWVFLYCCVTVPFVLCFYIAQKTPFNLAISETVVSVLLFLDVIVLMNTGVLNSKTGVLTCERWSIVWGYLKTWLLVDLMAAVPWCLLAGEVWEPLNVAQNEFAAKFLKSMIIFRVPKMLHMNRKLEQVLMSLRGNVEQLRMVKVILCIILVCHYNACFWYLIGTDVFNDEAGINWLMAAEEQARSIGQNLETVRDRYILSFYASVVSLTTVGYGEITPTNNLERVYAACMLLVGSAVFSFLVASTSNYVSQTDALEHHKQQQLKMLHSLIEHHHLNDSLRSRIIQYAQYQLERDVSGDQNILLRRLPPTLRREVMMSIHGAMLFSSKVFSGVEEAFLSRLVIEIETVAFLPNQIINRIGDRSEQMMIIGKGFVEEYANLSQEFVDLCSSINITLPAGAEETGALRKEGETTSILSQGQMWGDAALLREPELLGRRSVTFVEAAEISLSKMEAILSSFPDVTRRMKKFAAKRHAKFTVLTRKLGPMSASVEENSQFAKDFLLARAKLFSLLNLVKRAYESSTFSEEEIRGILSAKSKVEHTGQLSKMMHSSKKLLTKAISGISE